jgi:hypothetical protein
MLPVQLRICVDYALRVGVVHQARGRERDGPASRVGQKAGRDTEPALHGPVVPLPRDTHALVCPRPQRGHQLLPVRAGQVQFDARKRVDRVQQVQVGRPVNARQFTKATANSIVNRGILFNLF